MSRLNYLHYLWKWGFNESMLTPFAVLRFPDRRVTLLSMCRHACNLWNKPPSIDQRLDYNNTQQSNIYLTRTLYIHLFKFDCIRHRVKYTRKVFDVSTHTYKYTYVVLNLLRSQCLPVLLYGVEACPFFERDKHSVWFLIDSHFQEIISNWFSRYGYWVSKNVQPSTSEVPSRHLHGEFHAAIHIIRKYYLSFVYQPRCFSIKQYIQSLWWLSW